MGKCSLAKSAALDENGQYNALARFHPGDTA